MIEKHLNTKTYTSCNCKMIQYYQVYEENDKIKGGEGKTLKHVSLNKDTARKLSRHLGLHGGNGEVQEIKMMEVQFPNGSRILVSDSELEVISIDRVWDELNNARLKDSILAKLTNEEIGVLNI